MSHFSVRQNSMQFIPGFVHSGTIATVDNENKALRSCIIVPPQGPDFILATHILVVRRKTYPNIEFYILKCNGFNIKAHCRDGLDIAMKFELIENGCL